MRGPRVVYPYSHSRSMATSSSSWKTATTANYEMGETAMAKKKVKTVDVPWSDIRGWKQYGKCFGRDDLVNLFFSDRGNGAFIDNEEAKKICNGEDGHPICPVREQCRTWAIEVRERHGVWGGMTDRERKRARKDRAIPS